METIKNFIEYEIFTIGERSYTVATILSVFVIIAVTLFIVWAVKKALSRKKIKNKYEQGNLHALYQIIKYVIWIIAVLLLLETIGVKINALLAGSAALLVGIGLGLQHTFNNFVSGIILLFEGSLRVGDIIEVDGDVVKMERIGLRTSTAINRNDVRIIIPNDVITSNKVINWSHQSELTRFSITVGVAYGSNVNLVLQLLEESAAEHPKVTNKDSVLARLINFGNSSLDFEVLFFSLDTFQIENTKSDIRKTINEKFIEHSVTIPFPQMDVHIKSNSSST